MSSRANHTFYKALGRLYGPWCEQSLSIMACLPRVPLHTQAKGCDHLIVRVLDSDMVHENLC